MPDVLAYLNSKGLPLKRADARNVHTTCVFCAESPEARGRLYVNVDSDAEVPGLYFCHLCQVRGNLTTLKRHFGDKVTEDEVDTLVRSEILALAAEFYVSQLGRYPEVWRYLTGPSRGLWPETLRAHRIGYAPMEFVQNVADGTIVVRRPRALYGHLRDAGYAPKDILATGLCQEFGERIVDALGGMIAIPYMVANNVVAIRGRSWPFTSQDFTDFGGEPYPAPKAKYKTCGGTKARLFNVDSCWDQEEVTIAEGELDCCVLEQAGHAAVGVPGANIWQDSWDDYIKPLKRVWLIFDRDSTGEKAAEKLVVRFGTKVRRIHLSDEGIKCDVTEWFALHGAEEFQQLLDDARKGDLLISVEEARTEFDEIQGTSGISFNWELLDVLIAPGVQPSQVMILLSKTGCLAGDTEIAVNRGRKDLRIKIADLYDRWTGRRYGWDRTLPSYTVRAVDGALGLGEIEDVWHAGRKTVYRVTTNTGRTVKATDEHPFFTTDGWRRLDELTVGSRVQVNGGGGSARTLSIVLENIETETVTAISEVGEEDTFDLSMKDEPHNFMANGFIVHNTGKGHPLGTAVPTPQGLRRWGDLSVGDEVFGSAGTPVTVSGVFDRGVLPTYTVTFSDGSSVQTDADHLWTVRSRDYRGLRAEMTLTTKELLTNGVRRRKGRDFRYTIPMCGVVEFPDANLPIDPYTLGALIANGSLTGTSAVVSTPDKEVVDRIATYRKVKLIRSPEGACPRYTVRGTIGEVKRLGLSVHSRDKFIPALYLNGSVNQRIALLQGLFDGDGTARTHGGSAVRYSTTSQRLADDVVCLVASFGGTATQVWYERDREGRKHSRECEMSVMLPTCVEPFSLPRKIKPRISRTEPRRAIAAVEPAGEQEIRCISVDAPDSLYLVGEQYIVTHNTLWLLNMMQRMRMAPGQRDLKILFLSLEQTRGEWWDRARRIHRFYNLESTEDQCADFWRDNIMLVDRNRLSESELRAIIDDYGYQMGGLPDVICLDYLGYWARAFRGEGYERTSAAVMALKALAKEYRIPIIAPHQVNRSGRDGEEFGGDAAREAGTVEETADFLLTMWSPDNALGREEEERTGLVNLRIAKSRHGGRGMLLTMQRAPISLVMLPDSDPLCARARKEFEWSMNYRDDWETAVLRHRFGINGHFDRYQYEAEQIWKSS